MDSKTISKIIKLDKEFYKVNWMEFSKSRQKPWYGWGRVAKNVQKRFGDKKNLSILDIGCGNGRFLSYIREEMGGRDISYTGLDITEGLLAEAKQRYPVGKNAKFLAFDIFTNKFTADTHYDLVVAFGITHHIPSYEFRKNWLISLCDVLSPSSLLCLTFWQIQNDTRFSSAVRFANFAGITICETELEEGDYFLSWGNEKRSYRYVHIFSKNEIDLLVNEFHRRGLILVDDYYSDGKTNNLNRYLLFANNSRLN